MFIYVFANHDLKKGFNSRKTLWSQLKIIGSYVLSEKQPPVLTNKIGKTLGVLRNRFRRYPWLLYHFYWWLTYCRKARRVLRLDQSTDLSFYKRQFSTETTIMIPVGQQNLSETFWCNCIFQYQRGLWNVLLVISMCILVQRAITSVVYLLSLQL